MVHLISIADHFFQANPPDDSNRAKLSLGFSHFLEGCTSELNVTLIVEELSREALACPNFNAAFSTAEQVAGRLGICHEFCDPEDRANQNLSKEEREHHWLEKLRGHISKEIIFILGHKHLESFKTLLDSNAIEAKIKEENWGAEVFQQFMKDSLFK